MRMGWDRDSETSAGGQGRGAKIPNLKQEGRLSLIRFFDETEDLGLGSSTDWNQEKGKGKGKG